MTYKKEVMQFARDQLAPVTGDRPVAPPAVSHDAAGNQQDREEVMQIDAGTNARPVDGSPVAPPPSEMGGGDQVPELHAACWEIRWPSTPEGFEEIKCHGTNAVQDYRDHVHPEARSRELVYKDEAIAYAGARVAAETSALRAELDALKLKTRYRMGVGDGAGQLFVYGDYDSIKAAQRIVLRAETAERERDEARAIVDACAKAIRETGRHTRGAHETPHDLAGLIEVMRRDLDEARAEAERLRKDAERLNWTDANGFSAYRLIDPIDGIYGHCVVVHEAMKPRRGNVAGRIREAIDAAILADRGGESQ
jgi:hypothetical protein